MVRSSVLFVRGHGVVDDMVSSTVAVSSVDGRGVPVDTVSCSVPFSGGQGGVAEVVSSSVPFLDGDRVAVDMVNCSVTHVDRDGVLLDMVSSSVPCVDRHGVPEDMVSSCNPADTVVSSNPVVDWHGVSTEMVICSVPFLGGYEVHVDKLTCCVSFVVRQGVLVEILNSSDSSELFDSGQGVVVGIVHSSVPLPFVGRHGVLVDMMSSSVPRVDGYGVVESVDSCPVPFLAGLFLLV